MKKCVIVVGHEPTKAGAVNPTYEVSEYDFNSELASLIANELRELNVNPVIMYRDTLSELPTDINQTNADICISLHANAFNKIASGTETLFFTTSSEGRKLAEYVQDEMVDCLELRDRGIKPVSAGDRGGYLLYKTKMPTILVEPFFIDNDTDFLVAMDLKQELAVAIANGLEVYLR